MMVRRQIEKDWDYCRKMLPKVSRTFALNIARLKGDVFKAVLLGYLLFRIADTFEDTVFQDEAEKIKSLDDLSEIFRNNKSLDYRLTLYDPLKSKWSEDSSEKNLVENGDRVLRCYFDIPQTYREIMDPLLAESSEGMAQFQKRKLESGKDIFQLADMKDLQDYCYYVAGIVGVMLTKLFCQHESLTPKRPDLERFQVHFGTALQMINIVKDYKTDIHRGWCYIPRSVTEECGIELQRIGDLSIPQKQGIVRNMVPVIADYLDSSLNYIRLLPLTERSIRIFCILPFMLGYRTLVKIVELKGNKVSRSEVALIIQKSIMCSRSNRSLETDYQKIRKDYFEQYCSFSF